MTTSRSTLAPGGRRDILIESLQRGLFAHQNGDLIEAGRLYKMVLRRQPDHFDALHLLGMLEGQRGRWDRAERLINDALKQNDRVAEVWSNLGNVQHQRGRHEAALASFDRALQINPAQPTALNNRANALLALGRHDEALAGFDAALAANPSFAGALHNRGIALRTMRRLDDALTDLDKALALAPNVGAIHADRAAVLVELGRGEEALEAFERAVALEPGNADAHYNRGVALLQQLRFADALASFDKALAIDPSHAATYSNRGTALTQLGRIGEALESFDRALHQDPNLLVALASKGEVALNDGRYELAAETFERLVARDGEHPYALGALLNVRSYCCDWQNFDTLRALVEEGVRDGKRIIAPGQFLSLAQSPADQLAATQIWNRDVYPAVVSRPARRYQHRRIRLAYVSANFNEHAVGLLIPRLIERHDRTHFEVTAISYGRDDNSAERARLKDAFDTFIEAYGQSDQRVAAAMAESEIDIAIDVTGHAQGFRPGIFLQRPSDIQVTWLAYPGTTGLDGIDYIIADRHVIPENERAHYSEKVVYLPDTYFHYDDRRAIADHTPTRKDVGLPEHGFVFCCFNNNYKILPDVFAIWMRLLAQVDGSVLWLLRSNDAVERNLRQAAAAHGIAPERLVFAPFAKPPEHLARHRLADIFLDTLPYNAHTTSCDALWTGLPVITRPGTTFPARVAASQLSALGLPELITRSEAEYEALALKLAREPQTLAALREKLGQHIATHPLFDTDRYRQHMEAAFTTMVERHRNGEPPESFAVAPVSPVSA